MYDFISMGEFHFFQYPIKCCTSLIFNIQSLELITGVKILVQLPDRMLESNVVLTAEIKAFDLSCFAKLSKASAYL